MHTSHVDFLIQNARIFSEGKTPVTEDIAIHDGRIVARGVNLEADSVGRVIDASGKWLMPGLFDIHTHYDLELEVAPGLPESTRHGTTSVVIANCSLGLAFGNQRDGENDPLVSCFARVENLPKSVLRSVADGVDWHTPEQYLNHLEQLNLGPNVVTLMPHSMLRIDAMGFVDSVSRDPRPAEIEAMKDSLAEALDAGYAGFSTDALPYHYLAEQPHCEKTIPTQFANFGEIKALTSVVRERDAVWQGTPPKDSPLNTLRTFLLTSARLHGKALRTTVVAAMDVTSNRMLLKLAKVLAHLLNSKLLKGDFHLQALAAPFKIWTDGAVTPLSEEIPELRRLNEVDMEDRDRRQRILRDPAYVRQFKRMWLKGKEGGFFERLRRRLRMEDYAFNRTLADMYVDQCPLSCWEGYDFETLFQRVLSIKSDNAPQDVSDEERETVLRDFFWIADEADFMLQILRTFDIEISWSTTTANRDPALIRELLMHPLLMPGFNDSGAHLTNMAFYDCNLRALKIASQGGESDLSYMVKRLTKDAADLFGVEGGTINVGDVADIILVDPDQLAQYDGEGNVQRIYREEFAHPQLVNRSDGVVPMVMIGGHIAWENDGFSAELGSVPMGRLLKGRHSVPQPPAREAQPERTAVAQEAA